MNTNKLIIANPFSDEHVSLLDEFERQLGIEAHTKEVSLAIRTTTSEENYNNQLRRANDISLTLFTTAAGKVADSCSIQGTRDIKTCNISFAPLTHSKNRPLITMATDYALNGLGMEEVFVSIKATDKNMINNLETREFENLGEENGYITYLKEKEDQTVKSNLVQLH